MYQKYINFFFILFLLTTIFYTINYYYLNNYTKEHYLTYFLPYYSTSINSLAKFYDNNENNLNYFKQKINYNIVKIGTVNDQIDFSKDLLTSYIARTNLVKGETIKYNNSVLALDDLINQNINFLITDYFTILYYKNVLKKNTDSLRLVNHLYKLYFYIFTLKKFNIYNLNNIPTNSKIGVLNSNSILLFYKKFMSDLGYEENIDYTIQTYNNYEELFNDLSLNKINMILTIDIFPNETISDLLLKYLNNEIILLPFDIENKEAFLEKNSILYIETIDLNLLSPSYLPKKFNNSMFTIYKPDIKICCTYKILITTFYTNETYCYNISKFIIENYKYINRTNKSGYKLYNYINIHQENILDTHNGVKKVLYEKGYYTNTDNDNCKYLVGVMSCNETNLKNNNLYV